MSRGNKRIAEAFSTDKSLKLMTHVVGGYPSIEACEEIVLMMADKGVDCIEIQLPFSDPIADGPVILKANHDALHKGITTSMVFEMIERIRKQSDVPLLAMSYINPIYFYGKEDFVKKCADVGLDGMIVPDCPPEEGEVDINELCNKADLACVPLIAPSTEPARIKMLSEASLSPFVYTVLRLGVTGRKTELDSQTIEYLKLVKEHSGRYTAAGFGIRDKGQLDMLTGHADCGIIGSALLSEVISAVENGSDPVAQATSFLEGLV